MRPRVHLCAGERARRIRRWIRLVERRLVGRVPLLGRHDAVGATLFLIASAGMFVLGWLYWTERIPFYLCLLGNAFLASILHEIEHDLIHFLYFKRQPLLHNAMMFVVWALRGNVPHGWYRRGIHLQHHRAAGSATDVEERLLGLGTPWGLRRLLASLDGLMAFVLNGKRVAAQVPGFRLSSLAVAALPFYPLFVLVLVSFAVYHGMLGLGISPPALPGAAYPVVDVLAVAWVFPNYLRQAALTIVSSNVHYYGDVRSVDEETQVLRPFFLWPLQLFCFDFGTTHSLHHFVVEQPFYIRQLVSKSVLPALRKYGVRENDTGTFRRANRLGGLPETIDTAAA